MWRPSCCQKPGMPLISTKAVISRYRQPQPIWRTVQGGDVSAEVQAACIKVAEANRAFHWPLEFPAVMAGGGFDAVIGNPPWERIKLQEQEFFATRDAGITTAPNKAERDKRIKELKDAEPGTPQARLSDDFEFA